MKNEITVTNEELIQRFYKEVYVDWNMGLVDEVVSPRFISHDWPEDSPTGPQAFKDYYSAIRSAVLDARYEVDDVIAENDKVVVRWRMLGTHQCKYLNLMPSGKSITLKGIAIYRLAGGKLMERWVVSDVHGVLQQIQGSSPDQL